MRQAYDYWQNQPDCYPLSKSPSSRFQSRRRSEHVLARGRRPGTRLPQAVRKCTARRRFGVCFISIRGSSCWLHPFVSKGYTPATRCMLLRRVLLPSRGPRVIETCMDRTSITFTYGPHDCTQSGPSPNECALLSQHLHHRRVLRLPSFERGFFRGYSHSCVLFVKSDRLVCLRVGCTQAPPAGSLVLRSFTTRSCC